MDGFHARVVQHECDHLIGNLYPMRIRDFSAVRISPRYCFQGWTRPTTTEQEPAPGEPKAYTGRG